MLKVMTLFILFYSLSACSSRNKPASPEQPIEIPTSQTLTASNQAPVDHIQIVITESFPIQVNVVAQGHLPDSCMLIDQVTEERNMNTFVVKILTTRQPGKNCTPATQTFEEIIPLTVVGLKAGIYAVQVNRITDTFELELDNIIPQSP